MTSFVSSVLFLIMALQGGLIVCPNCSKDKSQDNVAVKDLKLETDDNSNHVMSAWTDAETLLLLESVLKHGDDWDLIAQHVRTKSKLDCISRLIQLPFGEHILDSINGAVAASNSISKTTDVREMQSLINEPPHEPNKADGYIETDGKDIEESTPEHPLKRRCYNSFVNAAGSLLKQVQTNFRLLIIHVYKSLDVVSYEYESKCYLMFVR